MQSSLPLVVTVWAVVLFRDRPTLRQMAGVMVSMAGVAFVAAHGSLDALLALRFFPADLWILASVAIMGCYVVLLRLRPAVHALSSMQAIMGIGALMVAPFYLWELSRGIQIAGHWRNFAGIGYMMVFPSFISYLFFNRGAQLIGAIRAGQSMHLVPVFGTIMAVLFLGESLYFYHLAGVVLVGTGIGLAQLGARSRQPPEEVSGSVIASGVRAPAPE